MSTKSLISMCSILAEAIDAAGPAGLPSGHLYAHVMEVIDLPSYQAVITLLANIGRITVEGHVLKGENHDLD